MLLIWMALAQDQTPLLLAEGSRSDYRIVLPADALPSEKYAAEELRRHLNQMSGADLAVVTETEAPHPREIVLNAPTRLADRPKLGRDGYSIRTRGDRLLIAGDRPRGTLYAVYVLLEEHLGCRWFTREVTRIPRRDRVELAPIDLAHTPVFEYREVFYTEAFDGDWAARHRSNGNQPRLEPRHGGRITFQPFVHSFEHILPSAKHFKEHPEYFSEIDGRRRPYPTQLCLTNPDVLRIAIETVRRWIREKPDATLYSVSQNDCYYNCRCAACRALDEAEGGPIGSLLAFVNRVAEAIEKDHPDKLIETLAYQYTRKPPKTLRPRPNVRIRLCSIECCFGHPLAECPKNKSFKEDLIGWSKITDRLYVWDYVVSFAHYLAPFPNFDVLGPNVRFYAEHGVKGLFEQGQYQGGGCGELSELRAYVLAKLLWNPRADVRIAIEEFTDAVYGAAGPLLRDYLRLTHDAPPHFTIGAAPSLLRREALERAVGLFDEGEKRLKDDPDALKRWRKARLSIDYARLMRTSRRKAEYKERFEPFVAACREFGLTHISEGLELGRFEKSYPPRPEEY
jgi:hypothetical protein